MCIGWKISDFVCLVLISILRELCLNFLYLGLSFYFMSKNGKPFLKF